MNNKICLPINMHESAINYLYINKNLNEGVTIR